MRIFLFILFLFCGTSSNAQSNPDSLRKYVVKLSTSAYARNPKNITYLNNTADWIYQKFEGYSKKVFIQKFEINKTIYKNVITSSGPDTAVRIVIGAHYDVFGEAPGADNNASGVAALIELARLFRSVEKNLKYRIDLIAYSLEEPPYLNTNKMGSFIHAKSMYENNIPLAGMINIKGIGFFIDAPHSQHYPFLFQRLFYSNKGDFISILQSNRNGVFGSVMKNLLKQYAAGLPVRNFKPAIPFPVLHEGDHKSYHDMGYPSLLISNTLSYRNKYYHYDLDSYETLDYFRMSKVVNMIYQATIRYK